MKLLRTILLTLLLLLLALPCSAAGVSAPSISGETMTLSADPTLSPKFFELPDRFVIDYRGGVFTDSNHGKIPVNGKVIAAVRYSKYEDGSGDDIARIVLDLQSGYGPEDVTITQDNGTLTAAPSPSAQPSPTAPTQTAQPAQTTPAQPAQTTPTRPTQTAPAQPPQTVPTQPAQTAPAQPAQATPTKPVETAPADTAETAQEPAEAGEGETPPATLEILPGPEETPVTEPEEAPLVILDAGHGGTDSGAIAFGKMEKDLVLPIVQEAGTLLEKAGIHVVYTRSGDQAIGLAERAALAEKEKAALFVSVHANAFSNKPELHGIETYCYERGGEAEALAKAVHAAVLNATGASDRQVRTAGYYVLHHATVPAILLETGYMTNEAECKNLASESYRSALAHAIASGVLDYIGK